MIKKTIIFVILLMISPIISNASDSKNIVITSTITPISSLAAMIAGDKARILTIASTSGCPHHYFLKPSDLDKMSHADLFIYIDENFDAFAKPLLENFDSNIIKISTIPGIKLINDNLHLWLLPDNAIAILKEITNSLTKILPEYRGYFDENLKNAIEKIDILSKERAKLSKENIVLLSDSIEYLFSHLENVQIESQSEYASVNSIKNLKKLSAEDKCFIISDDQDIEKYKKILGNKVVSISTENWEISKMLDLDSLYYSEYSKIIAKIISECSKEK